MAGRILIAKNRLGPDGIILPIYMDLSCLDIKIFEQTKETKDEIERVSAKKQFKNLQEKYREFKESENLANSVNAK